METFPATPQPTVPATIDGLPDTLSVQLGRGYREDILLSPNSFKQYSLRWANYRPAAVDPLIRFLERHQGSRTFAWVDFDGNRGLYRCRNWRSNLGQGLTTLSAVFEEVNY